jgi:hypothetical protein
MWIMSPGIRVRCSVCDQFYGLYDHAPELVYRDLDTCQMRTFIARTEDQEKVDTKPPVQENDGSDHYT